MLYNIKIAHFIGVFPHFRSVVNTILFLYFFTNLRKNEQAKVLRIASDYPRTHAVSHLLIVER